MDARPDGSADRPLTHRELRLIVIVLMVSLNISAGIGGQVLGRVKHYKAFPMAGLAVAIAAVLTLAWSADSLTLLSFEILLCMIGAGFGPSPSLNSVAVQNVVARHHLGISIGTMNFLRNLFTAMLIALLGAVVLTATASLGGSGTGELGGTLSPAAAEAAGAFRRIFFVVAACLSIAFIALVMVEQRPLRAADPASGR